MEVGRRGGRERGAEQWRENWDMEREKNNDGGSKEAERKIRVVEFMGQKTAQPA